MGKRPIVNAGGVTAAATAGNAAADLSAAMVVERALPAIDPNPETNPAVAALAAGAAVQTAGPAGAAMHSPPPVAPASVPPAFVPSVSGGGEGRGAAAPAATEPSMPLLQPPRQKDRPRFYFQDEDHLLIEQMIIEYRRLTGANVSPSRILRAALAMFESQETPEGRARRITAVVDKRQRGRAG